MRNLLISVGLLFIAACGNATSDASGGASTGGESTGGESAGNTGGAAPNACGSGNGGSTRNLYLSEVTDSMGGEPSTAVKCLPRRLTENADGSVPCTMARISPAPCSCEAARGMHPAAADVTSAVWRQTSGSAGAAACSDFCVCELAQLAGAERAACQTDPNVDSPPGFCYVDSTDHPESAAVLADCPADQKRRLRFLAETGPRSQDASHWYIACTGATLL